MERVRKTESGGYEVEADGRRYPAVEQREDGWIPCPYNCTDETHVHGVDAGRLTHRASHCREKGDEDRGYFLLRPDSPPSLFESAERRWWEEDPFQLLAFDNLGMGVVGDAGSVSGLFGGVL